MANGVLFLGWKDAKVGREAQAMELFQMSLGFWNKHVDNGTIESFEPVILSRHGGDLNGFFLIRGDRDKLAAIRASEELENIIVQGVYCLEGFGLIDGYVGDSLNQIMAKWGKQVSKG